MELGGKMAIVMQLTQWPTRQQLDDLHRVVDASTTQEPLQDVYMELPGRKPIRLPRLCNPSLLEHELILIFDHQPVEV